MITGMAQAVEYNSTATRMHFAPRVDGLLVKPTSAPTYAVGSPSDESLASGTMSQADPTSETTWIDYDAQADDSANFVVGEKVTGGTSGAIGYVVSDDSNGATGTLYLSNVDGTFQDDETLTGNKNGAATANGAPYSPYWYVDLDTSSTSSYDIDRNYWLKVVFAYDGRSFVRYHYFDVALYPLVYPVVTSQEFESLMPTWTRKRPTKWGDWTNSIKSAHRKLVRRINAAGENQSEYVKRDDEFYDIMLAFIKAEIAESLGFEDLEYWVKQRESAWTGRGVMSKSDDDDMHIEQEAAYVPVPRVR